MCRCGCIGVAVEGDEGRRLGIMAAIIRKTLELTFISVFT